MKSEMVFDEAILIVRNIIHKVNGMPVDRIKLSDNLITDLAFDSVELIDFILRLEEVGVIISESQLSGPLTIRYIAEIMVK